MPFLLQIISQNYVVWNDGLFKVHWKPLIVANYITKLRGLKLTRILPHKFSVLLLQIISQNYVVWNLHTPVGWFVPVPVANYITKLRGLKPTLREYHRLKWWVANYITKLRGLKLPAWKLNVKAVILLQIISQNYVVWNQLMKAWARGAQSCKLYHKTTWFETNLLSRKLVRYG